jgi:gluconokinase
MILILMGVSGSGKTTVGQWLAAELDWPFYEGDEFHPPANVAKMSQGIPLNDGDRAPWLARLGEAMDGLIGDGRSAIFTCSALKKEYRDRLREGRPSVRFVYLKGSFEMIHERLEERSGHYMPASLLVSQFEALEEPAGEGVLAVEAMWKPAEIVEQIRQAFQINRH